MGRVCITKHNGDDNRRSVRENVDLPPKYPKKRKSSELRVVSAQFCRMKEGRGMGVYDV